jgi:hypothetical protein
MRQKWCVTRTNRSLSATSTAVFNLSELIARALSFPSPLPTLGEAIQTHFYGINGARVSENKLLERRERRRETLQGVVCQYVWHTLCRLDSRGILSDVNSQLLRSYRHRLDGVRVYNKKTTIFGTESKKERANSTFFQLIDYAVHCSCVLMSSWEIASPKKLSVVIFLLLGIGREKKGKESRPLAPSCVLYLNKNAAFFSHTFIKVKRNAEILWTEFKCFFLFFFT